LYDPHLNGICNIVLQRITGNVTGQLHPTYRGADKSLAQPGWKQATATEDFHFYISYL
jgi:hypothetical protein